MNKYLQLFWTFFKIGLFTIGGGLAMLPIIQSEIVNKKKWINDNEMLDIIAIAQSTPGVIAVNTATFVGYKMGKFFGALMAAIGVILPSIIIICIISIFFNDFLHVKYVKEIFAGIGVGVSVLILNAALKIYKKSPKTFLLYFIMAIALLLSIFTSMNVIFIILIGASISVIYHLFITYGRRKSI